MSALLMLLSRRIPASERELEAIVRTACFRYKVYTVPKRSGRGMRTIAQPAPEVKWIQSILVAEVLRKWPVHEAATAYRKDMSTAVHASAHVNSRFLLKLDFADFFPSIKSTDVAAHVQAHTDLTPDDQWRVVNILTWRNKQTGTRCLSIGAPSSPHVSNSILHEFDSRLDAFCRSEGVTYTRYADDLALSTAKEGVLEEVEKHVQKVLSEIPYPRLSLNELKTVNVSKRYRRSLVGLVLTPDGHVSLGREAKKTLRAQIDWYLTGRLDAEGESTLRGKLAYALSVEPSFVARMTDHYGQEALDRLGISPAAIKRALHK